MEKTIVNKFILSSKNKDLIALAEKLGFGVPDNSLTIKDVKGLSNIDIQALVQKL